MKKGQSALEYLVTYGWAILIIVVIAAILWYFGVFNPAKWTTAKQSGGFSSFTVTDFVIGATNTQLVIGSTSGNALTITGMNETDGTNYASSYTCSSDTVSPGSTVNCNLTTPSLGSAGDTVDLTITISFSDKKSGLSHTDTGFLKGKVE